MTGWAGAGVSLALSGFLAAALPAGEGEPFGESIAELARELADLPADAPTWNAAPKKQGPLPEFVQEAAQAAQVSVNVWPFGRERALTWLDQDIQIR